MCPSPLRSPARSNPVGGAGSWMSSPDSVSRVPPTHDIRPLDVGVEDVGTPQRSARGGPQETLGPPHVRSVGRGPYVPLRNQAPPGTQPPSKLVFWPPQALREGVLYAPGREASRGKNRTGGGSTSARAVRSSGHAHQNRSLRPIALGRTIQVLTLSFHPESARDLIDGCASPGPARDPPCACPARVCRAERIPFLYILNRNKR